MPQSHSVPPSNHKTEHNSNNTHTYTNKHTQATIHKHWAHTPISPTHTTQTPTSPFWHSSAHIQQTSNQTHTPTKSKTPPHKYLPPPHTHIISETTHAPLTWTFIMDWGLNVLMRSPIHFSLIWELVIMVPAHPVRFIPEYQSVTLSQKKTPLSTSVPCSPDRRARSCSFSRGYSKSIRPSYCTEKNVTSEVTLERYFKKMNKQQQKGTKVVQLWRWVTVTNYDIKIKIFHVSKTKTENNRKITPSTSKLLNG